LCARWRPVGGQQPSLRTDVVRRTTVTNGVSATGALSAVSTENLGFPKGGKLTSVRVRVGEHVSAGQVLATVDSHSVRPPLGEVGIISPSRGAEIALASAAYTWVELRRPAASFGGSQTDYREGLISDRHDRLWPVFGPRIRLVITRESRKSDPNGFLPRANLRPHIP
jgi:Biotin-lipoyl like